MKKLDELATVTVEILPPTARRRHVNPSDAESLEELVKKQLAELLANRDDFAFQPYFQSKKVTDEIRRMQTIPEQRKFSIYYERWGCMVCGESSSPHCSLGKCRYCYSRILSRLKKITERYRADSPGPDYGFTDDAEIARQAFARPMKALPPAKSKKRARRSR